MSRVKWTSPGALLILAVALAGGIVLLDAFYFQPYVAEQRDAALRREATRVEQVLRQALRDQQSALLRTAGRWAESLGHADDTRLRLLAERRGAADEVTRAWLGDRTGCLAAWSPASADQPRNPRSLFDALGLAAAAGQGIADEHGAPVQNSHCQLACPDGQVLLVAGLPTGEDPARHLWLARPLSDKMLDTMGQLAGGEVTFIASDSLPFSELTAAPPLSLWMPAEDTLAVAWMAPRPGDEKQGYFLARLPVGHIVRQATAARRMVLIVLSLSMGVALLVIMGTHILVAGPVLRLLKRIQDIEPGENGVVGLTDDLHGEPLILARRLESAFDKLAHISKTDQLTGLANRRHFEEVFDRFYSQARRYSRPLSLIMIDIDFFKAINDAAGHQAGDHVLRLVSEKIEWACRRTDLPARIGGDEFAILLPETAAGAAEAVAQRLREAIAVQPVQVRGTQMNLTISVGLTDLNAAEIDSPGAMQSLADRALYVAKERGRDRVVQAHDVAAGDDGSSRAESGKVNLLHRKLAGLDSRFKDIFIRAIEEIMDILEHRDPHMADHARKVQHYALLIGREMDLPDRILKRLQVAAMLHDIGMVAMPDAVLLNPGALSDAEVQMMRRHTLLSVRIMEGMEFLEQEIPAVRYHHERFDGKGYPEGLSGPAIPLTARILSVADCFDAMTSPRTFRDAKGLNEAVTELRRGAGSQFDPVIVEAFCAVAARDGESLLRYSVKKVSLIHDESDLAPAEA